MFPDLTRDDVFRIETRRLWLRWPRAKDVDAIVRYAGDRAVAEMTALIPHPIERDGVEAFLLAARRGNTQGSGLTLALARRGDPQGLIGVASITGWASGLPELGYWLGKPFWRVGLMTEAVHALVDAHFAYAGGAALTASARTENPASRGVLEACGFRRTGTAVKPFPARGADMPVDLFHLNRAEWAAARRGGGPSARAA